MILDAAALAAVRQDLEQQLTQARMEKIFQPRRGDLCFGLRRGAEQNRLYFATENTAAWLGLDAETSSNPASPPAFCMLLRKHLLGGRVLRIEQPPLERMLTLVVEHFDEINGLAAKRLTFELAGRRGNAVLIEAEGRIIDALWRTSPESPRPLFPGEIYSPPPTGGRLQPADLAPGTLLNLLSNAPAGVGLAEYLQRRLLGLSRPLLTTIIVRSGLSPERTAADLSPTEARDLWAVLRSVVDDILAGRFAPHTVLDVSGQPAGIAAFPLELPEGFRQEPAFSPAAAAGRVYGRKALEDRLQRTRSRLSARVRTEIDKASRKRGKQRAEMTAAGEADGFRALGDLILSHLADIPRGAAMVNLPSLKDGETVAVPLDPSLSPAANAQAYYRRFQRAKRGQTAIAGQLAATEAKLAYLAELAYTIEEAENEAGLAEIAGEMQAAGLTVKGNRAPTDKKKGGSAAGPRRFTSRDGLEILVGRNNRQNEQVTFHLAAPGDTWLHAREIPGSHVIVKGAGPDRLPPDTLLDAANLAVYYSKARRSTKVPVDYTARRHVRKRPGGHPGLVHYDHFQTVIIDPRPELPRRLSERDESASG